MTLPGGSPPTSSSEGDVRSAGWVRTYSAVVLGTVVLDGGARGELDSQSTTSSDVVGGRRWGGNAFGDCTYPFVW